jgi:hypothetical protein
MIHDVMRVCALSLLFVLGAGAAEAQERSYKVLATSRTSTMEKEMREAGEAGYRFVAVMGGETAAGGKEVVVLMERLAGETSAFNYRLLAANRTSTLERELQEAADAGYVAVGQTVFESLLGGRETASIMQRDSEAPREQQYEYKLVATNRTSTLQKELQEIAAAGYEAIDLTVGQTALGGRELVVITRRPLKKR